ncbi:hypothetical protein JCM6292_3411 [Bacteroides pyogenes JCM 6292]|uniref:Uncharacterized protein n=2 Tax=Bacteroides pyogenes TaxID=310300 RepID=W4PKC3_9BACE|nr:hypothetical protein JCM6292_3411 [Bacteroides pyogenes JCM 6292]GAE20271.1 hypothetical protein JCM6294_3437 [Bacteroides pyogenes DSM 20611 = JCM 6294]
MENFITILKQDEIEEDSLEQIKGGNNSNESSGKCCKLQFSCNYRDGDPTEVEPQLQFC